MVELELDEQHPTSFTHSMRSNLKIKKKKTEKKPFWLVIKLQTSQ